MRKPLKMTLEWIKYEKKRVFDQILDNLGFFLLDFLLAHIFFFEYVFFLKKNDAIIFCLNTFLRQDVWVFYDYNIIVKYSDLWAGGSWRKLTEVVKIG